MNQSLLSTCQDIVTLSAQISNIGPNFISSSLITCLNLTNNYIESIENGAFKKLPNLTHLYLSYNNIRSSSQLFSFGDHEKLKVFIMNNATRTFESESIVEIFDYPDLEILSLRGNGFKDMRLADKIAYSEYNSEYVSDLSRESLKIRQKNPFPELKILDLSSNNIRAYNQYNYGYSRWNQRYQASQHNLNRGNGYYQNMKDGLGLASLENLHYLSVSKNKINYIESIAFQDTNKLIYLNLSMNNIKDLDPDTFAKLQFLNTLDLTANNLTHVPQISDQTNISNLYLSCNEIKKIISNAFVQTPNLINLLLGGNQISEIDSKAFAYLSILEILDLSKNKLNFLPEGWTKSLTSIKQLDLSDNEITSLESLPLTSALSLIDVYLKMNPLEYLNPTYFESLPRNVSIKLMKRSSFTNWNLFCSSRKI